MNTQLAATQFLPQHRFSLCHRPTVLHRIIFNSAVTVSVSGCPSFSLLRVIHRPSVFKRNCKLIRPASLRILVFKHPSLREGLGGPLYLVNYLTDVGKDTVELTQTIDVVMDAFLLIPFDKGLCL